jgi:hypothetical protein
MGVHYRFAYELLRLKNSYKNLIPAGKKLIENILSEHKAISWLVCALHCQRYVNDFCVGFNYKSSIIDNEVNCQLTVAQQQRDGVIEAKAKKDWVLYQRQYIKVKCNSSFRQDKV